MNYLNRSLELRRANFYSRRGRLYTFTLRDPRPSTRALSTSAGGEYDYVDNILTPRRERAEYQPRLAYCHIYQ